MIDRAARDETAFLLRRFAVGRITNYELEDSLQLASKDRAIARIFREGVWPLYDDLHEHRLVGRCGLTKVQRQVHPVSQVRPRVRVAATRAHELACLARRQSSDARHGRGRLPALVPQRS